jgi:hypothetical protein
VEEFGLQLSLNNETEIVCALCTLSMFVKDLVTAEMLMFHRKLSPSGK